MKNIKLRLARGWPFPGKDRLADLLFSNKREKKFPPTFDGILTLPGGMMLCNTRSSLEWQLYTMFEYEPAVTGLIQSLLKPGDVFMDVGANVGFYTLMGAHLVGSTGLVIAVEPNPDIFSRMLANCRLNKLDNVRLLNYALGESPSCMNLTTFPGSFNQGLSTLLQTTVPQSKSIEIQVTTGDRLMTELDVQSVTLIKIDVEGWEVPVLRGLQKTILESQPAIIFEHRQVLWQQGGFHLQEVLDLLGNSDYELFRITYAGLVPIVAASTPFRHSCDILALPTKVFGEANHYLGGDRL